MVGGELSSPEFVAELEKRLDQHASVRAKYLSLLISVGTLFFAVSSIDGLRQYESDLTALQIIVPRVFFGVLPFFTFAMLSFSTKYARFCSIRIFTYLFVGCFLTQAYFDIWRIAWGGRTDVLLFVGSVNAIYLCASQILLAPPKKHLPRLGILLGLLIWLPLVFIISQKAPPALRSILINDITLSIAIGLCGGYIVSKLYYEVELLRLRVETHSKSFLNKTVSRAIFEGKSELIAARPRNGFVAVVDIRDSTRLSLTHGPLWNKFFETYISHVARLVEDYEGTYIKSTGDGFILAFGIFRDDPDLSDIPGIEHKDSVATERIWEDLTLQVLRCFEDIYQTFMHLNLELIPTEPLRMAIGVDRGPINSGVRGDRDHSEFDVWGDKVNIAAKVEALSKDLTGADKDINFSILLSPYASDFVRDFRGFERVALTNVGVKGVPDIKWVLIKNKRRTSALTKAG